MDNNIRTNWVVVGGVLFGVFISGCCVLSKESKEERLKLCITILESPIFISDDGQIDAGIIVRYDNKICYLRDLFPNLAPIRMRKQNPDNPSPICARDLEKYMEDLVKADEGNGLLVLEYFALCEIVDWIYVCSDEATLTKREQVMAWAKTLTQRLELKDYDPAAIKRFSPADDRALGKFRSTWCPPPEPARLLSARSSQPKRAPSTYISSILPTAGSPTGGQAVTIIGSGFSPGATVLFGNTTVTTGFVNVNTITCVTPKHVAGDVLVNVHNKDGGSAAHQVNYHFDPLPRILGTNPCRSPANHPCTVTITGYNFAAGATVAFETTTLTTTVLSATELVVVLPSHSAGIVFLHLYNPDQPGWRIVSHHFTSVEKASDPIDIRRKDRKRQ